MNNLFRFIFFLLLLTTVVFPHGGKDHKKEKAGKQDTLTIVGGDTIASNGISKSIIKNKVEPETLKEEPMKLNPLEQLFVHLHNKVVHFPIALGVLAFLLTLINFKWKNFDSAILISVLVALLFSIGAFITGKNQSEPFIGTAKEWIVELHENIGIAVLISYFLWTIFLIIDKNELPRSKLTRYQIPTGLSEASFGVFTLKRNKKICVDSRSNRFYSNSYSRIPWRCNCSLSDYSKKNVNDV